MWKMRILRKKIGCEPLFFFISLIFFSILGLGYFLEVFSLEINALVLHLGLLFLGISFICKENFKNTLKKLIGKLSLKKIILIVIVGLVAIVLYTIVLSLIFNALGINDHGEIIEKIKQFTPLIVFMAIILGPIGEEIFFRAFLVNRFGILISSIVFALAHFSYGSTIEIIGAFGIGLILAYIYKKSNSLIPCLLIHSIYNFSALFLYWCL